MLAGWAFPPLTRIFDIKVLVQQKRDSEFIPAEKITPIDIRRLLLNVYGD